MTVDAESLVSAIHKTHDVLRREENDVFWNHELTPERYTTLVAVKRIGTQARITDVACAITRSMNSVSMLVDRMVKEGLLKRKRDKGDRREVRLTITPKAKALLEDAEIASQRFARRIASRIPDGEKQKTLVTLLAMIRGQ